jgi:hypothetical protein
LTRVFKVSTPKSGNANNRTSTPSSIAQRISRTTTSTPVARGDLDEKNEVYQRAVALEEREDEDDDIEMNLPARPRLKTHAFKISIAIMLVIITQSLGVIKVRQLACRFQTSI